MSRSLVALAVMAAAACAGPPPAPPDSAPAPTTPAPAATATTTAGEALVGTVRVVGSAPLNIRVVLQPDTGGSVQLTGPLAEELREMSGVVVAVSGPVSAATPGGLESRAVEVTSYEIRAVDGEPVVTGTVEGRTGEYVRLRTPSGELIYLANAPAELQPGQKIWVRGASSVIVQAYGTIR